MKPEGVLSPLLVSPGSMMALSVVDLYSKILPRTNCRDCGFQTCIAFAGMVVSEKHPLENCPHLSGDLLDKASAELEQQYKEGKWLKKDMAQEALSYAKERAASMTFSDIAKRIDGRLETDGSQSKIRLSYFNQTICITQNSVIDQDGNPLTRNEQTFVYIHLAQGGKCDPTGKFKSFKEFPNTVSKIISMKNLVETPLSQSFSGQPKALENSAVLLGGRNVTHLYPACTIAFEFSVFPKVPVVLLYWDENDEFDAEIKLMFDQTIIQHMDIESIMFLSEHLAQKLIHTKN